MPTITPNSSTPSIDFSVYKKQGEPDKLAKSQIWQTAIGLQQVDGLTPSDYLIETAKQNIEGEISLDEVKYRIDSYYKINPLKNPEDRTGEADIVSTNIAKILSEETFTFSPAELITIHQRLFTDIYKFAGKIRDYNITKAEWVLNGNTIYYASTDSIKATLEYDFEQEKKFDYQGLTTSQIVEHLVKFVSSIWQIHPFGEGNTRAIAVFTIKYLRTFGFKVENDLFAEHAWYFRNALVRANYNDYQHNIYATQEYLYRFFGNLLLGEHNELKNRYLKIDTVKLQDDTVNDTVFSLIQKEPNITAKKLAERLGISIATVKRKIKSLKEKGLLTRMGSDKTGYWKL
jgi:fido (protein-threonine AMPylation protein)